jgi:hypothetical protein
MVRMHTRLLALLLWVGLTLPVAHAQPTVHTVTQNKGEPALLRGTLTYTRLSVQGYFVEETKVVLKGTWRAGLNYLVCGHRGGVDRKAQSLRGLEGTLTWTERREDTMRYPPPQSDSERDDMRQREKLTEHTATKAIRFTVEENDRGVSGDQRGALGCITLDAKNKRIYIDQPWWNPAGQSVAPHEVSTRMLNQLGEPMKAPPRGQQFGGVIDVDRAPFDPAQLPQVKGVFKNERGSQRRPGDDGDYFLEQLEWNLSFREDANVEVRGPRCACNAQEVELIGATTLKGGTFEKFEVTGGAPKISVNQGGTTPKLRLSGDAKASDKVKVVAVYKKADGGTEKSAPFEVSFCQVDKPSLKGAQNGRDYVFSNSTLTFDAEGKAWLNGKEASDQLKWSLASSLLTPENLTGKKQTFRADHLPEKNTEFGEKELKTSLEAEGCACNSEPVKPRFFFERDGEDNPGGQMPNWAYYWKQTKAGQGLDFEYSGDYVPETPACGPNLFVDPVDPNAAARYNYCEDVIYVANVNQRGCYGRNGYGLNEDKGIDCFAVALKHENTHRREFIDWWGLKMAGYNLVDDPDRDMVPNRVEEANKCSKLSRTSCPSRIDKRLLDLELDAYQEGWKWPRGSAKDEDWAKPGSNWP